MTQQPLTRFTLPDPQKGIERFEVDVRADSRDEALKLFLSYLTGLKRRYSIPPLPIDNETPGHVGYELLRRLSWVTEPIAYILTTHLFCEHWLNQVLLRYAPNRDLSRYDFFKKLEIAFALDKLTKELYVNLCKLNDLRKAVAHNPNYDLTTMDVSYLGCEAEFQLSQCRPSYSAQPEHHNIYNVLHGVMFVTYYRLHQHCLEKLGFAQPGDLKLCNKVVAVSNGQQQSESANAGLCKLVM